MSKEYHLRKQIVDVCKSLFDRNYTCGSSGNLSVRLENGGYLMTPTNSSFGNLDPDRISRLDREGNHINGDPPTKEVPLHFAFYEENTDVGAIVHLHSVHAVALACLAEVDSQNVLSPLTPYSIMKLGRVPLISYHRPGAQALADEVRKFTANHTAVLLANHGPVVSGKTLEAAVYAAEELEETARLYLLLQGQNTRILTDEQIRELSPTYLP